jgi:2,4-dienoyl-CoA reductase (NADPH2)
MTHLERLFKPISVGGMELRNRVVMAPAELNTGDGEWVSERTKVFYAERARGGVGLIIIGLMSASPCYPGWGPHHLGIYDDKFIPSISELVEALHTWGAKVAAQVEAPGLPPQYHGGPIRLSSSGGNWQPEKGLPVELVGPSHIPVSTTHGRERQRSLTIAEIEQIIDCTAEAARRAREAGFDAVDLRFGVGSLVSQFISPLTNRRGDEYGGDLEGRMRFAIEIISAIKRKAGQGYPVLCKMSGSDFLPGGHALEDNQKVAAILEKSGIAAINVAGGWFTAPRPFFQMSVPRGSYAYLAEAIKEAVRIPVMASYRINHPFVAEQILAERKADLVAMVRALIADPEFVNKAREGRLEDIRNCIACCRCFDMAITGSTIKCTVNPRAAREAEYAVEPAQELKKVFVIGGGPAGMQTAMVAAMRGHSVTLFEKKDRLGGQLLLASLPPHKEELRDLITHLARQVEKAGVKLRVGEEIIVSTIEKERPNVVIIATGAVAMIPDIPGVKGGNVATAIEILAGQKGVGHQVVVVGGGMVGCETAEFLVEKGKKVTIIEMLKRIGNDITPSYRWVVLQRLRNAGVRMETNAKVREITERGVWVDREGQSEFIDGDTVILAVGMQPSREVADRLEERVSELHLIGDCVEARLIREALEEGFCLACQL